MSYQPKTYRADGGNSINVVSGGTLSVSGGAVTIANGTFVCSGTTIPAVSVQACNAAGSVIGNATALTAAFCVVDLADNATGVKLPVAVAGSTVTVKSTVSGKTLNVYPQVNAAIDALGANAAYVQAAVNCTTFRAVSATQWYSQAGA
jgi:hypothetical protein